MSHYGIPWPVFRRATRFIRRTFFTVEVPDQPYLVTDAGLGTLRRTFGRAHFTNAWQLSYHYHGEALNMRRPDYDDADPRPWKQTHVRGFPGTPTRLYAHLEYEPTAYPDAHLHNVNLDVTEGLDRVGAVLDSVGIAYEYRPND